MDHNDILKINKQAKINDEGIEFVDNRARKKGEIVLMCLMIFLVIYNLFKGFESNDLMAILWAYTSVLLLHKYKAYRRKTDLVATVSAMVAAIANLLLYFLQTW